ncbi:MAG: nucleotidyltransferase family protein [Thermohalobaculum sp.]|nr:nucleotidyltransferase family protein [Thermohalobaculum sp.]
MKVAGGAMNAGCDGHRPAALPRRWAPELRLLARLLAVGAGAQAARAEARRLARAMDAAAWRAFADLAVERHRVAPIVLRTMTEIGSPAGALAQVRAAAEQAAIAALRQKAETLRIVDAVGAAGIAPMVLKGWPLAERLYGSAALRQTRDIDLLVRDADFATAAHILRDLGYVALAGEPAAEGPQPPSARALKDIEFALPGESFTLELHARSIAYRGWPALAGLEGGVGTQLIGQTGRQIGVPSARGDLVFLAVHGLQHVFSRLRWLHDIAVLIEARADAELVCDLEAANRIAAARFVRIAGLLAARVFGSRWPQGWALPSRGERLAARLILDAIASDDFAGTGRSAAIRRVALKFLVADTMRQRLSLLGRSGRVALGGGKDERAA